MIATLGDLDISEVPRRREHARRQVVIQVSLEWIRGRRIPPEREAAFHLVGIVVLLTLMVIISFNDLTSPLPAINWGGR